jgi:rhodanese-related sulfurtransferase
MIKQSIQEALFLIFVAVVIALIVYAIRPDKITPVTTPAGEDSAGMDASDEGRREIAIEAAWELFKKGGAVFADSRHRADYDAGHIEGAVHLPAADPDAWLNDFLTTADPMVLIITYCDGDACPLAEELVELLLLNGFENVRFLKNGMTRWRQNGFPVQ